LSGNDSQYLQSSVGKDKRYQPLIGMDGTPDKMNPYAQQKLQSPK